mgnify:CR=1 FL=1
MRALVPYDRYTELLSKRINRTITPVEAEDITSFEAAHMEPDRKVCPKCNWRVHSPFMPSQIVHDIEKCQPKTTEP